MSPAPPSTDPRVTRWLYMVAAITFCLIVVGGYNSSNTSHLAEMGEGKLPTFFIRNASRMESAHLIRHYNQHLKQEVETSDWLPTDRKIVVGVTAGASCPNNLIEDAIRRIFELRGVSVQELLGN